MAQHGDPGQGGDGGKNPGAGKTTAVIALDPLEKPVIGQHRHEFQGRLRWPVIPANPDTDTSPVLGPRRRPRAPMARSPRVTLGGRGCARPASEGSLDESPSRPDGISRDEGR